MDLLKRIVCTAPGKFCLLACCIICLLMPTVLAADATIEAEFGDVLNLHGFSNKGDRVYLFMTGPGLPVNGVTLTDVSKRADQGEFTLVDVDTTQQWSMKWYTGRLERIINPGTYTIYVSINPVDKANLGGTSTYQTLDVYLKRSTVSRSSSSTPSEYMLYPEQHVWIASPAPTPPPTTIVPPPPPATTLPVSSPIPLPPATKAMVSPAVAASAVLAAAGIFLWRRSV